MELEQITMDPAAAQVAYEDYATAVRANHDDEDRAIAEGYKALAEGKVLIELSKVLAAGGTRTVNLRHRFGPSELTVPRLAIIRADAKVAFTRGIDSDGGCVITADKRNHELHPRNTRDRSVINEIGRAHV
jgi:hypothetical protein